MNKLFVLFYMIGCVAISRTETLTFLSLLIPYYFYLNPIDQPLSSNNCEWSYQESLFQKPVPKKSVRTHHMITRSQKK